MSGSRGDTVTATPELAAIAAVLLPLPSYERMVGAGRVVDEIRDTMTAFAEMRRDAVWELDEAGLTWQEIADLIGVCIQRAHDLGKIPRSPPRRQPARRGAA